MRHSVLLGKETGGKDLEELREQRIGDALEGELTAQDIARFHLVTSSMRAALDPKNRDRMPEFSKELPEPMRAAMEALYMAYTATDKEHGAPYLSALERSKLLNQALRHVQGDLALALRPDFKDGREIYRPLVEQITELRGTITWAILAQIVPKAQPAAEKEKEQDDAPVAPAAPADADGNEAASSALGPEPLAAAMGTRKTPADEPDLADDAGAGDDDDDAENPASAASGAAPSE